MAVNVEAYTTYRILVLFTPLASKDFHTGSPLNLPKNGMSDNIRNKAIFEMKIANIAQNLPKFDILHIWL